MDQTENPRSCSGPITIIHAHQQAQFIAALEKYTRAVFHELIRIQNALENSKRLSERSITSFTFWQYSKLPKLLSDQIFYGKNPDGRWTCPDLLEWFNLELRGSLPDQQKTVFKMLDFDKDKLISVQDCSTLLFHSLGNPLLLHQEFSNKSKAQISKENSRIKQILYSTFSEEMKRRINLVRYAQFYAEGKWDLQDKIWSSICQFLQSEKKIMNFKTLILDQKSDQSELIRSFTEKEEIKVKEISTVCEGTMYTLTQTSLLQASYYRIRNSELFIYSSKTEHDYKSMIYLGHGACVTSFKPVIETVTSKRLFGITLTSGEKKLKLYVLGHTNYLKWKNAFAKVLGVKFDIVSDYSFSDNCQREETVKMIVGQCRQTGTKAAIQIIDKKANKIEDIRQSIQILKMAQHENIVDLKDIYQDLEKIYLVYDYVGITLKEYKESLISRGVMIERSEMIGILKQVLKALQFLKKYNIVLRNISTDHIILTGRFYQTVYQAQRIQVPQIKLMNLMRSGFFIPQQDTSYHGSRKLLMEYNEWVDLYSLGDLIYKSVPGLFPPVKPVVLDYEQVIHETDKFQLARKLKGFQQFFVYMVQGLLDRRIFESHLSYDAMLEMSEFRTCELTTL